ncbi:MAG: hypothetical protein DVB22_001478 [Verrucomicrobia bacterium]|jgi:hypothetical protein|nr:MAG: hypothetical protein DVB22_001478 [Verrucomicrobiota bacterium]
MRPWYYGETEVRVFRPGRSHGRLPSMNIRWHSLADTPDERQPNVSEQEAPAPL